MRNQKNTHRLLSILLALLLLLSITGITVAAEVTTESVEVEYDYEHPFVPNEYSHIEGTWNEGFIIQDQRGNQFVWVPVGFLPANGTLNSENFCEKFGRRNYRDNEFSEDRFHEDMDDGLKKQFQSIQKYGGFYLARYTISKGEDGELYAIKGMQPLTSISFIQSLAEAKKIGQAEITSHLVYGSEFDTVLEWFMVTGKSAKDIAEDSTAFGNYENSELVTGSREEWQVNGIYDLAGSLWEWTQEASGRSHRTIRGGERHYSGSVYPVAYRGHADKDDYGINVGFRVALYIP